MKNTSTSSLERVVKSELLKDRADPQSGSTREGVSVLRTDQALVAQDQPRLDQPEDLPILRASIHLPPQKQNRARGKREGLSIRVSTDQK